MFVIASQSGKKIGFDYFYRYKKKICIFHHVKKAILNHHIMNITFINNLNSCLQTINKIDYKVVKFNLFRPFLPAFEPSEGCLRCSF